MSRVSGFGISAAIPDGWEARIHRHPHGEPTLHAATFRLPARDGDFGSNATARMPAEGLFLSLTEYRAGDGVDLHRGLFAHSPPRKLDPAHFSSHALLRAHPGQRGLQRFFSTSGRAFCLYVVVSGSRTKRRLAGLGDFLCSLDISRPG